MSLAHRILLQRQASQQMVLLLRPYLCSRKRALRLLTCSLVLSLVVLHSDGWEWSQRGLLRESPNSPESKWTQAFEIGDDGKLGVSLDERGFAVGWDGGRVPPVIHPMLYLIEDGKRKWSEMLAR